MEWTIPIFLCFGLPVSIVFISKYYSFRTKQLEHADRRQLRGRESDRERDESEKERAALEARIQNLESIVCSVDFELNQRLNRLAAGAEARGVLPGPRNDPAAGAAPTRDALPAPSSAYRLGQLAAGQLVLDRYTVERELGHGGMGSVYLAHDRKLGERVALKTVSSLVASEPGELVAAIRREVQAARKVTHGNVVRIHDLHEDGPLLFLSMEYIEGETLWARVKRRGPLPVSEACEVLQAVGAGVAAAHAAGVVHRDLKPHNVILCTQGVKIIDFGIAQQGSLTGMTATGIILGTPEYMAPEQIRGGRVDARSDVYSLGAMAYYALCGQAPFVKDSPIGVAFAQVNEQPRPPRDLRPELPLFLEEAILRALGKEPASRFPDAAAWQKALQG